MSLINKYIQWIIAFNIIAISAFDVIITWSKLFSPSLSLSLTIVRPLFLILMLVFQIQHFGAKLYNKLFVLFVLVYHVYILLYITILRVYPIDVLLHVPKTSIIVFYRLLTLFGYLLCAKTIVSFFDVYKFLTIGVFFTVLPSLLYVQFIGVESIQILEELDEDTVSLLAIGYNNAVILVIAFFAFIRSYKNKPVNAIFPIIVFFLSSYVILISSKRGPILWSVVNIVLCFYITTKRFTKYILVLLLIGSFLVFNIDSVIDSISSIAPKTAERISNTIYEQDTNGRFDMGNKMGSVYLMGLQTFETSPIWGSYFRIVALGSNLYRGVYPHNIFIEMLMTMGIMGFIPFLFLLFKAFRGIRHVFRNPYSDGQLACLILFLAPFLQLQTTETIVTSMSFWVFFYIMCVINNSQFKQFNYH